jgi:dolichol-phosphate mannosyltransferase
MLKSIILCTFNESESITAAVYDIEKKINHSEIIIVDDNSTDGTLDKLKDLQYKKNVKILVRKKNKGLASAFLRGIMNANGEYIGWIDTNMNYLLEKFKHMEDLLNNDDIDIVVLSRYVENGGDEREFLRRFTSKYLNKFCKLIYRSKINDFSSGIFLMKKKILDEVSIIGYGHGDFFIEFLYNVEKKGFKIREVPYIQKKDVLPINSKSAPNIFKFALYGVQYFLRILNSVFRNN